MHRKHSRVRSTDGPVMLDIRDAEWKGSSTSSRACRAVGVALVIMVGQDALTAVLWFRNACPRELIVFAQGFVGRDVALDVCGQVEDCDREK